MLMRNNAFGRNIAAACLLATLGLTGSYVNAADAPTFSHPGITNPSEQRGLNFNVPGAVARIFVKEGDIVKKGDLVAQQDDTVELAELKVKEAEAKSSSLQVDAAKADLAQKKVELVRQTEMYAKHVAGKSDVEKAQLDVTIGEIRVKLADEETNQKVDEANSVKARIAQKKLFTTIDGIVQKINVHDGELATNDPKTPCIQIVLNQPLSVEVDMPVSNSAGLKAKQKMDVRYLDESKWREAEISFLNPVANAAAGTQRIRLSLDNPENMRSGLQVEVTPFDPAHDRKKDVAVAQPAR